jgi:hypothetical protein
LDLLALGQPDDAEGTVILVAAPDEIKVAHFENLKMQHSIGKKTVTERKEREAAHGRRMLRSTVPILR